MNDSLPLTIRPMVDDDVEAVQRLDQQSFTSPWPEGSYKFEVKDNKAAHSWVAEIDNRLVGMIVTWLAADEAQIATLAVEDASRRQRIGYRLVCKALGTLVDLGARKAFLEVRGSNAAAQALYRRFGFQVMGRRPGYYKDGEDAILMKLRELDKEHLETIACQFD